ncbi:E3 ubiquitin/ISG15 ligase TRIM25-like isoform X2 [Xyrichtys novacula]|uniref:E3 ubiquitin/ISG15 ligase TRIM25-like isoform X2 n=1 Tax=Xyrichtys novacula TaxID=13765 RepID=A0AAV1GKE1_XYRNO|nr:E3 ubiquitin/ISG15 ligase TRIM25-like isoform X2 [Xyrichtys novacula]
MAQKGNQRVSCSICHGPPKDPVTKSCGHSYCTICIKSHWDRKDKKGTYSCPQCEKTIRPRPDLKKINRLAKPAVKKIQTEATEDVDSDVGGGVDCDAVGDVDCDVAGDVDCDVGGDVDCDVGGDVDCDAVGDVDCDVGGNVDSEHNEGCMSRLIEMFSCCFDNKSE